MTVMIANDIMITDFGHQGQGSTEILRKES